MTRPPSSAPSRLPLWLRLLAFPFVLLAGLAVLGTAVLAFVLLLLFPNLPSIDVLTDYQPKIPLRIYSADGVLIGEFGEERRAMVQIAEVPVLMKQAILAAEDDRFYQHSGVDILGVLRAAYSNLAGGGKRQGASTITMQVARNFFLSSEKTITRKAYEAMLAFKIEASLSKDQILEIYINQIYLGQRAYGFASAAQVYYGKNLKDIVPAEAAMLAGLPKAPSSFNPVVNPKRAKLRQLYVLRRMHELGHLTDAQYAEAQKAPLNLKRNTSEFAVHAEYAAEMVRQMLFERYPDEVYSKGFRVYTTITKADQDAAYAAVRRGVLDYDRRHGYRGAEGYADLTDATDEDYEEALSDANDSDDLIAALVLEASPKQVKVYRRGGDTQLISGDGLKFAARMLEDKAAPNKRIQRGAIVRIQKDEKGAWSIVQLPEVEAAFISVTPQDGAVRSLVGGFDFNRNKYNHVTQAWRQPGSSFKPFIYSASLEKGFTPATVINDAPVVVDPFLTGGQVWEPKNYDGKYEGPMRMRTALAKSKNMVSIRILQAISPQYAQDYITRFGFDAERHPPYLTMALGAGAVTLWQMARGYSTFANTGYRIEPYIVSRIVDDRGNVLAQAQPQQAGDETLRVIDARNAFIMDSMLRDVTRYGTATRASVTLKRQDLAGKTGTTNDFIDAWFNGYHPTLVGVAWIGFDQPKKLGNGETGGSAALPIWINYMSKALSGVPEMAMNQPEGVVSARISEAGMHSPEGKLSDFFYRESLPPPETGAAPAGAKPSDEVKNQLF
ncbi:MAG: penicillin-binding protein 1A [Proteobacteria bacterium]|nr:penicillin-binding protein 1A [Pseudomonadota bacterium]